MPPQFVHEVIGAQIRLSSMNYESLLNGNLSRLLRGEHAAAGRMIQLRYWQLLINELLKKGAFKVPIHLGFGSEALVTSVDEMMTSDDKLVLTHRNAVFNMARCSTLQEVLAEYRGEPEGMCGGVLGSMNLVNSAVGIPYSSSILGNNFSVACGLAFANEVKGKAGIVCVVTGDGAMEEGAFYESLVFSKSHNLKVLFLVDNNNHSMVSSIPERRCDIDLSKLASSLSIPFMQLEGNELADYIVRVKMMREQIVSGNTPACLEVKTTLLNQHAGPTPGWPTDPLKIEFTEDFLIADAPRDPLAVLKNKMGTEAYMKIIHHLMGALRQ